MSFGCYTCAFCLASQVAFYHLFCRYPSLVSEPADNLNLQKYSILKITIESLPSRQMIASPFLAVNSVNQPIFDGENL